MTDVAKELTSLTGNGSGAHQLVTLRPDSVLVQKLQAMSAGNKARLQKYLDRIGDDDSVFAFDLSQNAEYRCRIAHETHMSTLTKNCTSWYIKHLQRCF